MTGNRRPQNRIMSMGITTSFSSTASRVAEKFRNEYGNSSDYLTVHDSDFTEDFEFGTVLR